MNIELTSKITVDLIDQMGGDYSVAAAAKVSVSPEDALALQAAEEQEGVRGLIRFLMKRKHGSPFEHSTLQFYVHVPIFVWREWHRHRVGFSYNEESARYKQLEPVFYFPPAGRPLIKEPNFKPAAPKFLPATMEQMDALRASCLHAYETAYEAYVDNLDRGFDPGMARIVLPVGIYSSGWVTCNPRSLMHFLSLRTHEPEARDVSFPLYEIEVAARLAEEHLAKGWPIVHAAFNEHGRRAP